MNVGKKFESNFKDSIPDFCLLQRLKDPPQAQNHTSKSVFSWDNPCDFLMFDAYNREFWCLELKSTKQKYISYEDIHSDKPKQKMVKKHQILGLLKFSRFNHVNAGFMFNFRDEDSNSERTYYQDVRDFTNMCNSLNKTSFNEIDLVLHNSIKVNGEKLRVNYRWNINKLITDVVNRNKSRYVE